MTEDLRQADLSHLDVRDMTPAQRAELRRRYEVFVARMRSASHAAKLPAPPKKQKKLPKWTPTKRVR
jgi:hypothetical protein